MPAHPRAFPPRLRIAALACAVLATATASAVLPGAASAAPSSTTAPIDTAAGDLTTVDASVDSAVLSWSAVTTPNTETVTANTRPFFDQAAYVGWSAASVGDVNTVVQATLELYVVDGGAMTLTTTDPFAENTLTWASRPPVRNTVGTFQTVANRFIQIDVTTEVRAGHRSFAVGSVGGDAVAFASSENPTLARRPSLILRRGPVVSVPTSIANTATCSASQPDVSAALQAFLDSVADEATVRFPAGRCYRSELPLVIDRARAVTIDGNGSTIAAFTDGCASQTADANLYDACRYTSTNTLVNHKWPQNRAHFVIANSADISVRNLRINGGYATPGTYTEMLAGQHAFDITANTDGAVLDNVWVDGVAGDYVYAIDARNVTVQNSTFGAVVGNGRQGFTVTDGINVYFRFNTVSNVTRSHIDLESNYDTDLLRNIVFEDNTFNGPRGTAWFSNVGENARHEGIYVRRNTLRGMVFSAMAYPPSGLPDPNNPDTFRRFDYQFVGNTSDLPSANPLGMLLRLRGIDGLVIRGNSVVAKPLRDIAIVETTNSRDIVVVENTILNGGDSGRYVNSVNICERDNRIGNPLVAEPDPRVGFC